MPTRVANPFNNILYSFHSYHLYKMDYNGDNASGFCSLNNGFKEYVEVKIEWKLPFMNLMRPLSE